jgi:hypothetical protein
VYSRSVNASHGTWQTSTKADTYSSTQTLSTTYASEVVPTVLRPYVTAYVCMCWGAGQLLASGVVRATVTLEGDIAWKLPFMLQWIWPVPLFIGAYMAPESPWNAVRRNKVDLARKSMSRLRKDDPDKEREVEAAVAYIRYTTALEMAETENANFLECFRGTNLRRTEIVSSYFRSNPWTRHEHPNAYTVTHRTASFGPPRFSAVTQSLDTRSSSSKAQGLVSFRPSTSTSLSLHATSSAVSFAGYSSRISDAPPST